MNRIPAFAALVGVTVSALSPASADDGHYIAGSGVSRGDAQVLTLDEIAVALFNNSADGDDRQVVVTTPIAVMVDPVRHAQLIAAAGIAPDAASGLTLDQLAVAKFNADAGGRDRQQPVAGGAGTGRAGAQLVATAGLTAAEAEGLTLAEVAAIKFARDAAASDR